MSSEAVTQIPLDVVTWTPVGVRDPQLQLHAYLRIGPVLMHMIAYAVDAQGQPLDEIEAPFAGKRDTMTVDEGLTYSIYAEPVEVPE